MINLCRPHAQASHERRGESAGCFGGAYQDHEFFFGREDQTFALYRLIDRFRFVTVVGSSGSGKSSLVRAGLLPLLDTETKGAGGRNWVYK